MGRRVMEGRTAESREEERAEAAAWPSHSADRPQSTEDPNGFLQARPLFSPVVIVCKTSCILAIGTIPVLIFPKEDIYATLIPFVEQAKALASKGLCQRRNGN
ncbi:hypothetical protein EYF80_012496 [Liparis tanakae]|uniref:Uncharacterized protein n=1 Tax=Liparis tanakae TaxID=230148 RepID=A0A4Z2IHI6_9TELE|nr:hypothetical protein EYF80_012496 [Liparis tanakae]